MQMVWTARLQSISFLRGTKIPRMVALNETETDLDVVVKLGSDDLRPVCHLSQLFPQLHDHVLNLGDLNPGWCPPALHHAVLWVPTHEPTKCTVQWRGVCNLL